MRALWRNSILRYGRIAVLFHWSMTALILFMFALGPYMANLSETDPLQFPLFQLHKSIGLTVLVLALARVTWRLMNTVPVPPIDAPRWENVVARTAHWSMYLLMFAVPIAGWAAVSAAPLAVPTMWFGVFEWPHLPFLSELPRAAKRAIDGNLLLAHAALAFVLMAFVATHIAAAFMHHYVRRDQVLKHMLTWKRLNI